MSEKKPKPCPFCGSTDIEVSVRDCKDREGIPTAMTCADCGCTGPWSYEQEGFSHRCLAEWNNRKQARDWKPVTGEKVNLGAKVVCIVNGFVSLEIENMHEVEFVRIMDENKRSILVRVPLSSIHPIPQKEGE